MRTPGRRRSRELPPETTADIVRRYRANQSLAHISFALGVSEKRVRQVLVTSGVSIRKPAGSGTFNTWFKRRPSQPLN